MYLISKRQALNSVKVNSNEQKLAFREYKYKILATYFSFNKIKAEDKKLI